MLPEPEHRPPPTRRPPRRALAWTLVALGAAAGLASYRLDGMPGLDLLDDLGLIAGDRAALARVLGGLVGLGHAAALALLAPRWRWPLVGLALAGGALDAFAPHAGVAIGLRLAALVLLLPDVYRRDPAGLLLAACVAAQIAARMDAGSMRDFASREFPTELLRDWARVAPLVLGGAVVARLARRSGGRPLLVGALVTLALLCVRVVRPYTRADYLCWLAVGNLQFGDVDGDGRLDLMSWGCQGRAGGNPAWWRPYGRRFVFGGDDTTDGQSWAVWCDADGDGRLDHVSVSGVSLATRGPFGIEHGGGAFPAHSPETQTALYEFAGLMRMDALADLQTRAVDLDGRTPPELFFSTSQGSLLLLGVGPARWTALGPWPARSVQLDCSGPQPRLIGPRRLMVPVAARGVRVRHRSHALPVSGSGEHRGDWLDIDGDGTPELVIWRFSDRLERIEIYRELPGGWSLLRRFEVHYRHRIGLIPAPAHHRWADVDRDGDLDFVADDDRVYRQGPAFRFVPVRRLGLPIDHRARRYVVDLDGDGWPDVVSTLRPWMAIVRGPLLAGVP